MQTLCGLAHYDFRLHRAYSYEQAFNVMRALRLSYAEAQEMFRRLVFNVKAYDAAGLIGEGTHERFVIDTARFMEKIKAAPAGSKAAVFIGPEGGFAEEEIELAKNAGIEPISLGRRILRTETAGMALLSMIMYELERS